MPLLLVCSHPKNLYSPTFPTQIDQPQKANSYRLSVIGYRFEEDFEACVAQLQCPTTHRKRIRTTNLLERLFREERRRSRAAGIVFGERPLLKLMYSALIRASDTWRGIQVTELERAQLQRLRETIREQRRRGTSPVAQEEKEPSAPVDFSSKKRT
ncbi:MAG: transposase [Acidobacteriota bacterium]